MHSERSLLEITARVTGVSIELKAMRLGPDGGYLDRESLRDEKV